MAKCVSRLVPDAFYNPAHREVYEVLLEFADKMQSFEFRLLTQVLRDRGQLDEVGGKEFLDEVFGFVPTGANATYYIDIVREKYCLRLLKQCFDNFSEKCGVREAKPEDLLAESHAKLADIEKINAIGHEPVSFRERIPDTFDWIEQQTLNPPRSIVSFGIPKLDNALLPIEAGNQIVISGDTVRGKTAFALQTVLRPPGQAFAIFSLEMPARSLVARMFANEGQICFGIIRQGKLTRPETTQLHHAMNRLGNREIYIEDVPVDVRRIAAKCREIKRLCRLSGMVVDYLQLVTPSASKSDTSRERDVAEISRSLKSLALELGIIVIALSQLNDSGQLRESRAIGQDADIVLQIAQDDGGEVVRIKKNRNGPRSSVPVTFDGEHMLFSGSSENDPPAKAMPFAAQA